MSTLVYMPRTTVPKVRTQVYLTQEQRQRLAELGRLEDRSMAELVREAIDDYLGAAPDAVAALEETFGAVPDLTVPSRAEWQRG